MTARTSAPRETTYAAPRTNRYAGVCVACKRIVPSQAGVIQSTGNGWKVFHGPGGCDAAAGQPQVPASARVNQYAGKCADCGGPVEAETGTSQRGANGWEVRHAGDCPVILQAEPAGTPAVAEGYYATVSRTGRNDFDFWKVEHGTGQWAGRVFVRRVIGGQSPQRISRGEQAAALDAILAEGEQATRERYADVTRNCWACDIHLTDGLSRLVKTGPDCCRNRFGMTQRQYARSLGHPAEVIAAAVAGGDDDAEVIEQAEAALAAAELAG